MDLGEIIVGLPIIKWILGDKEEITPSNPSANDLFDKMWEAADNNCGEGEEGKPLEVTIKNKSLMSKLKSIFPIKKLKNLFIDPTL
ncbi:hypothetical protein LCGC14_1479400 [marine sediment metagenome]|uniref:Uncharacterized protein n=1 Tax=marine sediment metagenome TaxID=412755 RepID=A0A0F9LQC7_9ZZZZ